ncbi:MAG: hypothetical protein E5Y31_24995 [Mesorhizobium sp.]|nr:MAG: hypothetical protein E5Y31_24995 [Mesorhizobium sp.]
MKKLHPVAAAVSIAVAVAVSLSSWYSSGGSSAISPEEKTELAPAMLQPGKRALLFDSAGF